MPPTLADRVRHILEAIHDIDHALAGKSPDAYAADRILRLAIERLLEIICEATRALPDAVKTRDLGIPWQGSSTLATGCATLITTLTR